MPAPNPSQNPSRPTVKDGVIIARSMQVELAWLDHVHQCVVQVRDLLRANRKLAPATTSANTSGEGDGTSPPVTRDFSTLLAPMKQSLMLRFETVRSNRQRLASLLNQFATFDSQAPSLAIVARSLPSPIREQLLKLRSEVREKLYAVHALTSGCEAVLLVTLDFDSRLLAGLSNQEPATSCYSASGQPQPSPSGTILQTNC